MQYTNLGRTGMKVSRLCLGTGNFGTGSDEKANWGTTDEREAHRIMDAALDAGINFFDTANVYGGIGHRGLTEEIIGRWFAQGNRRRERVVLGTKVGRELDDEADGPNKPQGLSLYKIRRHFEGSLRRLQTDHIELLQMHHVDRTVGWDELWEAFESLVRQGTLDYVGASNFTAFDIMKAQGVAARRGFMGLVCEQHRYDPLNRLAELEVLPCLRDQGIAMTIFSPLWRGLLGINMLEPPKRPISDTARRHYERSKERLTTYSRFCRELGQEEAVVTLAWELAQPGVTAPIIGPCTVDDLLGLLPALELRLGEPELRRMDEIFAPAPPYFD